MRKRDINSSKTKMQDAATRQQLLGIISDNIADGIFFGIPGEEFQYVNKAFLKITGYRSLQELKKIKPRHLYVEFERWKEIDQQMRHGQVKNEEALFRKKNGDFFWGTVSISLLKLKGGKKCFVGSIRDIADQKKVEQQLLKSQQLLDSISTSVNEGIYRSSAKKLQYVNEAFVQMFGYGTRKEVLELDPRKLFAERKTRGRLLKKLRKDGKLTNEQVLYRRKNGQEFWGLMSGIIAKTPQGEQYIDGAIRDITKSKEAEDQLQKKDQLLGAISKNITEGIYRSIPGKKFAYVNRAFLEMFGFKTLEELNATKKPANLYADQKHLNNIRNQLNAKGEIRNVEALFKKRNGEKFWGTISSVRVTDADGNVYFDGAIRDITRQKEIENQLEESRVFLDNVMKTVAAPIFVKDSQHRWVMFNDAFCWFMDKSRKELTGKSDRDFLSKEDSATYWKVDNQVLRTGDVILNPEKITLKNGKVRHLLTVKSRYVTDQGEKFVIGFITDITEIRKREEEINKLNANLLGVMESTHESIYAIDKDFNYIAYNSNHANMAKLIYGAAISIGSSSIGFLKGTREGKWLRTELIRAFKGEHFVSVQKLDKPRYPNRYIESTYNPIRDKKNKVTGVAIFVRDITDIKRAEQEIYQTNATLKGVIESTKDRILAVDRKFNYIMFNKNHAMSMKRMSGKDIRLGDNLIAILPREVAAKTRRQIAKAFNGEASLVEVKMQGRYLETSISPIRGANDRIIGATLFVRDISLRKSNEQKLRLLNDELVSQNWQLAAQEEELKTTLEELSEKNFELDQLMYKTSHDLRSPLSSILGLINLAHLDKSNADHMVYLTKIEGRVKKLDEFIRSMLNYARVSRSDVVREQVNIGELIQGCIHELEYLDNFMSVKAQVAIKNERTPFRSDGLRVKIILSNIISNAYKYYNPSNKSYLKINVTVTPFMVEMEFRDNGIGIKKEYVSKIFDMFYRATEKSQGSGLGMYIVKQAVDKLKGSINVKSNFGKGTRIKITLPNN